MTMTSDEIKRRALALSEKTNSDTITPTEVGGIMYDTVGYMEDVERNGASLGIRKTYATVSAMEADLNPVGDDGSPLKKGMLVNIYDQDTPDSPDNGKVFSFQAPGWAFRTKIDAGYATKEELSELERNIRIKLPLENIGYTLENGGIVEDSYNRINFKSALYKKITKGTYQIMGLHAESVVFFNGTPSQSNFVSSMLLNGKDYFTVPDGVDYCGINYFIGNPKFKDLESIDIAKIDVPIKIEHDNLIDNVIFKQGNFSTFYEDDSLDVIKSNEWMNITIGAKYIVNIPSGYKLYFVGKGEEENEFPYHRIYNAAKNEDGFYNGDTFISAYPYVKVIMSRDPYSDNHLLIKDVVNIDNVSITLFQPRQGYDNKSFARKGARLFPISGEPVLVYSEEGEGILETMFFAGTFDKVNRTKISVVVDGSVSILGYIYELCGGLPANRTHDSLIFGNTMFGKTGTTNGIYLNYKVPFYKKIDIYLHNEETKENPWFWFSCRTSKWHDFYIAGMKVPYGAKLFLNRQDFNVESGEEFTIIDTYSDSSKRDKMGIIQGIILLSKGETSMWYMEGMIRAYKKGSSEPELISSGLEDYFLGTYYFATGTYQFETAGCLYISQEDFEFGGYRLHNNDLWSFDKGGYRVTIRNSDINVEEAGEIINPTRCSYAVYPILYYF